LNEQRPLSVVLGTGPLGLAVARQLAARGPWVRAVSRSGSRDLPDSVEVVRANLTDRAEVVRACAGAGVVYHCASPPYDRWRELHPPLMAAIIEGAAAAEAKLIFGDNLYAYGPVDGPIVEDLPHRAAGPNGQTRARIAADLMSAHELGRVRAAIGCGSDFFGPHARQSLVGERVFVRALAGKQAQLLGNPDASHSVTYIEDFARALLTLAEREEALGRAWHVPNDTAVSTRRFVEMVFQELGRPARLQVTPRWVLALAGLFNPTIRAVTEQLYQVERPWVVDSSKFEGTFGWRATPLPEAVRATLAWFKKPA
jgi:nucleoside-diphosphate-sugar epimerase